MTGGDKSHVIPPWKCKCLGALASPDPHCPTLAKECSMVDGNFYRYLFHSNNIKQYIKRGEVESLFIYCCIVKPYSICLLSIVVEGL